MFFQGDLEELNLKEEKRLYLMEAGVAKPGLRRSAEEAVAASEPLWGSPSWVQIPPPASSPPFCGRI
jgi:hypothetical protein